MSHTGANWSLQSRKSAFMSAKADASKNTVALAARQDEVE
jgi:hypothetical protein